MRSPHAQSVLLNCLSKLSPRDLTPGMLIRRLNDPDEELRATAAALIAERNDVPLSTADTVAYYVAQRDFERVVQCGEAAVDLLLSHVRKRSSIYNSAMRCLGELGDSKAIEPLKALLPDLQYNQTLVGALRQLGWKPESNADVVYEMVGTSREQWRSWCAEHWEMARSVLLNDANGGDRNKAVSAARALLDLNEEKWRDHVLPLCTALQSHGDADLARSYLNAGNSTLSHAAESWAKGRGYLIVRGPSVMIQMPELHSPSQSPRESSQVEP